MKKLLFLGIPLLMMGVLAANNDVESNCAKFENTASVSNNSVKPLNARLIDPAISIGKKELNRSASSLLLEDPNLQKDIVNEQDIQNEKRNFGNKIGKGLNLADCSPLAYKNNSQHTQDIFDTSFLNDLYVYGDFDPQFHTDSSSDMTSDATSLTTKMGSSIAVSAGVEATYACVTAEVSTKVGFSVEFSNTLGGSVAVYNYNYYRQTYGYYLPLFEDHRNLYKNHLTTLFKNDLSAALQTNEQSKYDEFFEKYGSHVLMSGFYGGASTIYGSIISSELKDSVNTKESVANTVKGGLDAGAYKLKASVGEEISFSQGFEIDTAHSQETYYAEYYGGEATPASHSLHAIFTTADTWATTIDAHPVCIKYDKVIPVWWLLTGAQDTLSNAQALERAFEVYRAERSSYYLSLAYQVEYSDALTYTHKAMPNGEVIRVADYWDKAVPLTKQFNLLGSEFYYLPELERANFNKVQLVVKCTATAKKADSKLTVKVILGGHDYGFGYYHSLNINQETEIVYDALFREDLSSVLYKNSSVTVELRTNDGGVGSEKEIDIKNLKFDIIYTRPQNFGTGTDSDPYLIYNVYQFANIQNKMDACYKLAQDIYFNPYGSNWEPLPGRFTGTLYGNGFALRNVRINKTGNLGNGFLSLGLFKEVGVRSYINNLTIIDSLISVSPSSNSNPLIYAGFITGMHYGGTIYNCTFQNTSIDVKTTFSLVGTVCGYSKGQIRYCTCKRITLYSKDVVGGIVGTADTGASVVNCKIAYHSGTYSIIKLEAGTNSAGSYRAGGIAGYGYSSNIKNCRVEYTCLYLSGSATRNPAMGYIVGHLSYANITSSTQSNNIRTNSSTSKYFFACDSGKVGRKEGTCTVS